jgi:polysaccharide export outer membrane protein
LIPSVKDKNVSILGQVHKPLVLPIRPGTTLIEAISRAEGITDDADLVASVVMREGQVLTVDFEKLLKHGDASQNVVLKPNDVVLIPDVRDKKVFVLGAVNRPTVVALKPGLTVVESIAVAGGFAEGAQPRTVVLVRGGLANPTLLSLNLKEVTDKAEMSQNAMLLQNDIIFVPKSFVHNLNQFFRSVSTVLTPIILARAGLTLGADLQQIANPGQNAVVVP